MKKTFALVLVLLLALSLCVTAGMAESGIDWNALVDGVPVAETASDALAVADAPAAQAYPALNWTEIVSSVLYAILAAVSVVITKYIIPWLKSLTTAKTAKIQNDKIRAGLDEAADAVLTAVTKTNQKYVEALKDKNLFDEAAQKTAFSMSWQTAQSLLTDAAKNALVALYGGVDDWLEAKIEQTTNDLKKTPGLLEVKTEVVAGE